MEIEQNMAEEFADFMNELNHKALEDQLSELKGVVNNMVDLIANFIENYTTEIEIIHNKIIALETKDIISEMSESDKLTPIPSFNPPRVVGREAVRISVNDELKKLFKKRGDIK